MGRLADVEKALNLSARQLVEDLAWFAVGTAFVGVIALGLLPGGSELNWPGYFIGLLNCILLGLLVGGGFYTLLFTLQFLVAWLLLESGNDLLNGIHKISYVVYYVAIVVAGVMIPLMSLDRPGEFFLGWLGEVAAEHLASPALAIVLGLPFLIVLPICVVRLYRKRRGPSERDPKNRVEVYSSFLNHANPARFKLMEDWFRIGRTIARGVSTNAQISSIEERMSRLVSDGAHESMRDYLGQDLARLKRVGSRNVRRYAADLTSFLSLRLRWINIDAYPKRLRDFYSSWLDIQETGRRVPGELVSPRQRFTFILLEGLIDNLRETIEREQGHGLRPPPPA